HAGNGRLTLTTNSSHMTAYEGHRCIQSLRQHDPHPSSRGPRAPRRKLSTRTRADARCRALDSSESRAISRTRRLDRRPRHGPDSSLRNQFRILCRQGAAQLGASPGRGGPGASKARSDAQETAPEGWETPVKIGPTITLPKVAVAVGDALRRAGIR